MGDYELAELGGKRLGRTLRPGKPDRPPSKKMTQDDKNSM